MIKADYHTHSHFSTDSEEKTENIIKAAYDKGLTSICLTDHMDLDFPNDNTLFVFNPDEYFKEHEEIRRNNKLPIKFLSGIEIGLQPYEDTLRKTNELINKYPFDFVIGSTHIIDSLDPFDHIFWENRSKNESLRRYFETIYENIKLYNNYDVLGHIDYCIRYVPDDIDTQDYNHKDFSDILEVILKKLIYDGKGLEINCSSIRKGLNITNPKVEVLKMYKDFGGEILTFGSDAHKASDVANPFKISEAFAIEAGFKYYATFEKRQMTMHKI